ncbi:hypothetical protein [Yoonia sp. 208BN28-4]|uniref:hypothetical protein n=1 Tax=Yoonia sp. 208BN28-4 TaxID=3126505 RepID=UPI00309855B6
MTALKEFDRLESGGLWHETPQATPRDVTVSFGNATLVIADGSGIALTHWSLPAIERLNPGERPARFAPDVDASEMLEIEDSLMIDAVEKVRKAVLRAQPHPGKLRHLSSVAVILALIAGAAFWAPKALTQQTLSAVPLSKRNEIGATVLGHYQRITGPTCRGAAGTQALGLLKNRLLGTQADGQFVVVQTLPSGAVTLPGGISMIDRAIIEQHDDVAVTAGYLIAANSDRARHDPLEAILQFAGLRDTFTLFTTGDLPGAVLQGYAEAIAEGRNAPIDLADLSLAFDAAQVPSSPYAAVSGDQALVENDSMAGRDIPLILQDRDWVRLQGICTL